MSTGDSEVKTRFVAEDDTAKGMDSIKKRFNDMREMGEKISQLGVRLTAVFTAPVVGIAALVGKNEELQKSLQPIKDEFEKVINSLAKGLIPVIKDITPAILGIVKGVGDLVAKFNALSTEQKENILKWVGIIAAIGPVIVIVGQLIGFVGTLGSVLTALGGAGAIASIGLGPLLLVLGSIALLIWTIVTYGNQALETLRQMGAIAWGEIGSALQGNNDPTQKAIWTQQAYRSLGGGGVSAPQPPTYITNVANVNYSPTISTADRAQVQQTLTPIVQDAMRSFVPTR